MSKINAKKSIIKNNTPPIFEDRKNLSISLYLIPKIKVKSLAFL